MLSFAGSLKVFVAVEPCDMRKGFNGLPELVTGRLGEDTQSGALFVFTNRRRNRLKILFWDRTGLWVCTNRLVSQCPLNPGGEIDVSVPSFGQSPGSDIGYRRTSIRHDCGPIGGRNSTRDSGVDV